MNKFLKKQILLGCLLLGTALHADENSRKRYLELIKEYPHIIANRGNADLGEIEILLDEEKMVSIEKKMGRDVGVVKEDRYWLWINDACKFPSGYEGVYGRILWVRGLQSPSLGVAVVPMTAEGKIVLNCNFRHSTRSWEIELPRGLVEEGETAEEAAKREASEETGRTIEKIRLLGALPPDTGVISVVVPLFVAQVAGTYQHRHEETEAIEEALELSLEEIKQAFAKGYYTCKIRGEQKQVYFRDPFLAYALVRLQTPQGCE